MTQTIKTPAIPISPTDDSCATMAVRSKDVETATTDVSMMHDDDDALVEGDPEEGPVHLDLGSDSDMLISLGATPHQPLNVTFPQRVFKRIGLDGEENDGNEVNLKPSQKVSDVRYCFKSSWFQRWPWLHYLEATDSVLCYYCAKAYALKITCGQRGDLAFISAC